MFFTFICEMVFNTVWWDKILYLYTLVALGIVECQLIGKAIKCQMRNRFIQ